MSVMQHEDFERALMDADMAGAISAEAFEERWIRLHENSQAIARMADLACEPYAGRLAQFPAAIATTGDARRALALRGLEDLDAMIQPGLTALAAIAQRGHEATAPALALWREFHAAREAMLGLCDEASFEA